MADPSVRTWDVYVENHLMRPENNHQLTAAAIIGSGEFVWAQSHHFPSFQEAEITSIRREFTHPLSLAATGLSFAGQTYMDIQHVGASVIRAKINAASNTGIVVFKTLTAILLIGMYTENPEECSQIVENLGNYITSNGQ